jgi:hypothetical protein
VVGGVAINGTAVVPMMVEVCERALMKVLRLKKSLLAVHDQRACDGFGDVVVGWAG